MPQLSKKRILIVCQHFWPESFRINDIADFLTENDYEVEVLCGLPNYPKGQLYDGYSLFGKRTEKHNNIIIHRTLEIPRGNNTNLRIFLNYISFPIFSLLKLPKLLLNRYDKIFIYQLSPVMMSLAGILLGKIKRVETTMYVLDLWPENLYSVLDIKSGVLRSLATKVSHWHYRKVDKLITLSDRMRSRLIEATVIQSERIIVLPQACEKIYETDIHDSSLASRFKDRFTILFTGNISPAQSFETILGAAEILRDKGLHDITWIIVGDGMSRLWLEDQVRRRDLTSYFSFEGQKPIEDIPRYTHLASVLVGCLVKSDLLEATIPAKVMSYIAAGRPIVLAMDGEVQTLINDTIQCGYAGPTEDPEALAANIQKIYALSKQQRNELGKRGKSYHLKHFERNIILKKLTQFIFS